MITYPAVINCVTLVFFTVYLSISICLAFRHGLGHSWPWYCLIILSMCRITQVSIDLYATQRFPATDVANTALETGVAILTELGLTPLFMTTSCLLGATSRPKGRRMQWILILLCIPLLISLLLIVAGGIDQDSSAGPTFAATDETKAGVAIYCASFVILIWSTAVISARLYLATPTEVKILTTVVISLPFFLVDVVYMMCFAFESLWNGRKPRFNVISGDPTLQLCMQVIMEYVIVGLYLGLGLELPDKAARLAHQATELDYDGLAQTFLWKLHERISAIVVSVALPILQLVHWCLHKAIGTG